MGGVRFRDSEPHGVQEDALHRAMRTDQDITLDCADRLHLTLDLDDQDIAIKVMEGLVLLVGIVRSDPERAQAERVVKKVRGVRGLANCLSVCPRNASVPPDPEITREAVAAMRHQYPGQVEQLQVIVQNGRIALEGELDWYYQRDVIEAVIRSLRGVTLVTNRIRIRERSLTDDGLTGIHES
jgi:osmotically-inducible protein OsmY